MIVEGGGRGEVVVVGCQSKHLLKDRCRLDGCTCNMVGLLWWGAQGRVIIQHVGLGGKLERWCKEDAVRGWWPGVAGVHSKRASLTAGSSQQHALTGVQHGAR